MIHGFGGLKTRLFAAGAPSSIFATNGTTAMSLPVSYPCKKTNKNSCYLKTKQKNMMGKSEKRRKKRAETTNKSVHTENRAEFRDR